MLKLKHREIIMRFRGLQAIVGVLLLLLSTSANAEITELEPLHFGIFALVNNDVVSTLKIPHDNTNPVASSKLFPITLGQAGEYQLTGYPEFTPLIITIADFQLKKGASEPLTVGSFTHEPVITDVNGSAVLKLGATLSTSGTSANYGDAVYDGNMNIVVTW